jgi:16S rRNA (adenine1518-N6/adenine1519-N6)-dimethyltransferase
MVPHTKNTLARFGLAPSKKRGQNFLVSPATAQAIVSAAAFDATDRIVEVGVGLGALTLPLAGNVKEVIGIEIDRGLVRYHQENNTLPGNVILVHEDILKTDFTTLQDGQGSRLKIITNLPYSISNPFIFRLIDHHELIDSVVMLLQKEVVDRLLAQPGSRAYGIPTVLLGSCATVDKLMRIDASQFHPKPKVDSQLIRIVFNRHRLFDPTAAQLSATVRSAFAARRKTLLNNLLASTALLSHTSMDKTRRKELISSAIRAAGLTPETRAEMISIDTFQELSRCLQNMVLTKNP